MRSTIDTAATGTAGVVELGTLGSTSGRSLLTFSVGAQDLGAATPSVTFAGPLTSLSGFSVLIGVHAGR